MTFCDLVWCQFIDLLKFETCSSALRNSEMANTTCGSLAGFAVLSVVLAYNYLNDSESCCEDNGMKGWYTQ